MSVMHRPASLEAALELLATHHDDANVLSGGTALMLPESRSRLRGHLVALRDVGELTGIEPLPDGGLRIGALTTHSALAASAEARRFCPALAEAFGRIANVRVRNQATLGGNLAAADPAHDPPAVLIALGAVVHVAARDRRRVLAVEDVATGPGRAALEPDEVVVAVHLPPLAGQRAAHRKFITRAAVFRDQASYPTVSCGAAVRLTDDGERFASVRLGLSGVHTRPVRARTVEQALTGGPASAAAVAAAAAPFVAELEPQDDERGSPAYKRAMAAVWLRRTVAAALASAPADAPGGSRA